MLGLTPRRRLVCFRLINAAGPLPLIDVDWNASALPDRADMHVAVIDVPSHTVRIGGASAGEDGSPIPIPGWDQPLGMWCQLGGSTKAAKPIVIASSGACA
jgi:hypothetical protein